MVLPINYLAVFVTAIVGFAFGALWYGPLFGKLWLKLMGWNKKELKKRQTKIAAKFFAGFVLQFLTALVLSYVLYYAGALTWLEGASVGFYIWLGFVMPFHASAVIWAGKPFKLFCFDACYHLVTLALMGAILAVWV